MSYFAYLLINVDISADNTRQQVLEFDEIVQAHAVFGPWDIVALAEVKQFEDLTSLVKKLREIDSIIDTITLVAMTQ